MKKKLAACAVAISGLIGTSAFAADMGVPAAPPPAPVWNWTGWYAGVNFGASFGNVNTDFSFAPMTVSGPAGAGGNRATNPVFAGSDTEHPDGFMGGGQIGYNWQYSPLIVVGLEADFQGAVEKDHEINGTNSFGGTFPLINNGSNLQVGTVPVAGFAGTNYTTEIDWFGTVRARLGYVWGNGQVMSYLTGGLAYGEVKINGTTAVNGTSDGATFFVAQSFGHSQVNTGWVAGYGTEGRLGNSNWTWKIEGLYMDLGHIDTTGVAAGASVVGGGAISVTGAQVTTNSHFTDGILRGGLNYKFY